MFIVHTAFPCESTLSAPFPCSDPLCHAQSVITGFRGHIPSRRESSVFENTNFEPVNQTPACLCLCLPRSHQTTNRVSTRVSLDNSLCCLLRADFLPLRAFPAKAWVHQRPNLRFTRKLVHRHKSVSTAVSNHVDHHCTSNLPPECRFSDCAGHLARPSLCFPTPGNDTYSGLYSLCSTAYELRLTGPRNQRT